MSSHLGIPGRLLIITTWMGLSVSVMSQEQGYRPVDIGQHIDRNGVHPETLSNVEAIFFLDKDNRGKINPEVYQEFLNLRNIWMEKHREVYLNKRFASDPMFNVDVEAPVDVIVKEFSRDNVRICVVFTIGHSRWHHYHLLLKDYLIERNDKADQMFRLKQLEERYGATFNGIGHGASFHDLVRSLGLNYRENIGQSIQYRTLYYPDQNLEVILQDGVVKYLVEDKPEWIDQTTTEEEPSDPGILFQYDHFNVTYIPELGFAATDSNGNFLFEVFPYDNGPDYPSEGLIRIRENGKVGYADMEGNVVIPPSFECAYPFQNGVARICEEGTLIRDGEHDEWHEAQWGAIDKEGNIIVEPFDLGMFTFDIMELKLYLHQHFTGQIEADTRWGKPDQIDFFVSGEGDGLFVDLISAATDKQLLVYLLLPWQDLTFRTTSDHDARIPTEQLVTVTQKYIVYLVYLAPLLSDEEM
ncbi:MAG: WG repeat-containing protein, partial [Bacteroidia bacterium]|nr:WG repeat-containing protein [Bacteroidia bacterium]